ncbi:acetyl-CoA synthetase [Verrucomicrobium sp. GAS474]|uniref:acetate--CoA ligase n=1 Tax=Verrucomicrobium sp. GAS474 TaxID=1882831 RepID=UPI00087C4AFB|nr:acetate--CoA ligase [Verrucomicrobium sp. GAS474]SDT89644.1 acetyl-CoA synthetase [Verrucomicrobium sp. GAS474]
MPTAKKAPATAKKDVIAIDSVLKETRVFKPSRKHLGETLIKDLAAYKKLHKQSLSNPESFWKNQAKNLAWVKPFKKVLEWKSPHAKWFTGGKINVAANCVDRHLETPRRNQAAIIWEGEPGEVVTLTYQQLHRQVCLFANVLKKHGIAAGDRVVIYLPMIPEAIVAMLACARIGAVHNVVFGGFSSESLKDRSNDSGAKLIITADGGYRRGAVVPLKENVDKALANGGAPGVKTVLVVRRTGQPVTVEAGRDLWIHEETAKVSDVCPAVGFDSEHPLFILYTSGSTGKPKGILHTSAGYLLGAQLTTKYAFDLRPADIFFCTADIGWITGHSYVTYGILANGGTTFMYEGAPNQPNPDRFWELIAKHKVNILYTAPTAIRSFIKWGDHWPAKHDLSSLRILGSVGEPINPEAWVWYHDKIGGKRCPIVDTWWQTETGSHMILTLPGLDMKPGGAGLPFFGVDAAIVDDNGKEVKVGAGKLILRQPWPSMLRTVYGDDQRYKDAYWGDIKGAYTTGDGAHKDKDGYFWIIGRIDDVLNVAGHRLGTSEVESSLVSHPLVAEAAVVGRPDELKGQAVVAFVTLKGGNASSPEVAEQLRKHVAKEIGPIAKPDEIRFADALPKTRSGKIMRRLLRQVAAGDEIKGDVTTLEDLTVLAKLKGIED